MNDNHWAIAILLLFALNLAGCESSGADSQLVGKKYVPPQIVYKPASQDVNQKAEDALRTVLSSDDLSSTVESLPTPFALCGPFLWNRIGQHPHMANIELGNMRMMLPVTENGVITRVQELDGKVFQNKGDILLYLQVLHDDVLRESPYSIRKLNETEKEIYWSMVPYNSIDEPIFIVEGGGYKLLVQMLEEEGVYYPFWIDDLKGVSIHRPAAD